MARKAHPEPAAEQRAPLLRRGPCLAGALVAVHVHPWGAGAAAVGRLLLGGNVGEQDVEQLPGPHLVLDDQALHARAGVHTMLRGSSNPQA